MTPARPLDATRTSWTHHSDPAETDSLPAHPPGFELLEEVGRGGMGTVYRARDVSLGRDVAIKVLTGRFLAESPAGMRFLSEARITGQLQHPGIPAVHQVGTMPDGRPFLAMKLIKGTTLADILKNHSAPTGDRGKFLAIFEAVCQAVGYAHAHQVIHRDLKPANIMVGAFGEVQVMDWGLAKVLDGASLVGADELSAELTRAYTEISPASTPASASHTQAGSMVGTPAYIPPEQACGELSKVDARADVFGLGAVLAVILTGHPPYVGKDFESVRVQAVRGRLDDCFARLEACGADPEWIALCRKCLAFEPADRPRDGGEVAKTVSAFRAAADERARLAELERVRLVGEQATTEARSAERRKRRRLTAIAAAVLVLVAIGGLSAVLTVQRRANADLAAKNLALAEEQAKVQSRFEMAQKAIATFHSSVSEDVLMQNPQFKDLRTKLLTEAAGFYADLEKLLEGQSDPQSRQLLAKSYFELGQLTEDIASIPKAMECYRKSLAIRQELADADPADVNKQIDVAHTLLKIVFVIDESGGNDSEGMECARKALLLWDKAIEAHPADVTLKHGWTRTRMLVAAFLERAGQWDDAIQQYLTSREVLQKIVDANPQDNTARWLLSNTYRFPGIIYGDRDKPAEALVQLRRGAQILEESRDPNSIEIQGRLARSWSFIAEQQRCIGEMEGALESNGKSIAASQKVVDRLPAAHYSLQDLAYKLCDKSSLLFDVGRVRESALTLDKALAIFQRLADANPSTESYQADLAFCHRMLGMHSTDLGQWSESMDHFRKAMTIQQNLVGADPKPYLRSQLAYTRTVAAHSLLALGQTQEARTLCDLAVAELRTLLRDGSLPDLNATRLAVCLVRQGEICQAAKDIDGAVANWDESLKLYAAKKYLKPEQYLFKGFCHAGLAGALKNPDEAKSHAEQAMTALKSAVQKGYRNPGYYKSEPILNPLRTRKDFKTLMAELDAKAADQSVPQK